MAKCTRCLVQRDFSNCAYILEIIGGLLKFSPPSSSSIPLISEFVSACMAKSINSCCFCYLFITESSIKALLSSLSFVYDISGINVVIDEGEILQNLMFLLTKVSAVAIV
ncbi:unnamed protein product [Moneuplotes crassus]|uniref:Uncharacterized protein n=1 Tax=Euplotes crassus TaxID=5936 RepID=A0AAD1XI30_EUPCR|nr:unnamed protein product [Moneuplotes crassus]